LKRVVYKFGGSSVRDAQAILRVAKLIAQNDDVKIAVISATYNTTNRLEWVYAALDEGDEFSAITRFEEIKNHHLGIFDELCDHLKIDKKDAAVWKLKFKDQTSIPYLQFKKEEGKLQTLDFLYSYGEWTSSWLVFFTLSFLNLKREITWADARDVILTNSQAQRAEPILDQMLQNTNLIEWLHDDSLVVTQGFIGRTLEGVTTTLGREGSDYSATLVGRLIKASVVKIWTDVPGVASFDPRLIDAVLWHQHMSYSEAEFLATGGAKVLFPRTLAPVKDENIAVIVQSSLNPDQGSTTISNQNLQGFAMAIREGNPSQVSLIVNFPLNIEEFFSKYSEILELNFDGSFGKLNVPSSIALDVAKKIHGDLYSEFLG
jgi:aspartate kinase